jgi:dienelactone hydrolase
LAAKHGITDWENNESTFRAIGAGLAKAGYRQVQVDAFKKNMASTPEQAEWIQKGFDSER